MYLVNVPCDFFFKYIKQYLIIYENSLSLLELEPATYRKNIKLDCTQATPRYFLMKSVSAKKVKTVYMNCKYS